VIPPASEVELFEKRVREEKVELSAQATGLGHRWRVGVCGQTGARRGQEQPPRAEGRRGGARVGGGERKQGRAGFYMLPPSRSSGCLCVHAAGGESSDRELAGTELGAVGGVARQVMLFESVGAHGL
jgi:hypothetical protein